ncbi:MAG: TIGR02206 family membrane protein [Fusobacteriaceae bacterium]
MFELFDQSHLIYLLGYGIFTLIVFFVLSTIGGNNAGKNSALVVTVLKLGELAYRHYILNEALISILPLHLCNIALIVGVAFMLTYNNSLFQLTYFWSIGSIFALLTPEVRYKFPNFWHISFFITHFYLFFIMLYGVFKLRLKPSLGGLFFSFFTINFIAVGVYFINADLGTNFMFLNYKPEFSSPLDYFGEWPYYIIPVECIFLALSFIFYLPFKNSKKLKYSNF